MVINDDALRIFYASCPPEIFKNREFAAKRVVYEKALERTRLSCGPWRHTIAVMWDETFHKVLEDLYLEGRP